MPVFLSFISFDYFFFKTKTGNAGGSKDFHGRQSGRFELNGFTPVRKFLVPGYIVMYTLFTFNVLAVHMLSTFGDYWNRIKYFLHPAYCPAFQTYFYAVGMLR